MPAQSEPRGIHSATPPTGTVTFLFSDIEGSTQRWEAHGEAMKSALARHERLLSGAIARHGGYTFKTIGDAFCSAFPTARQAVAAAIDAQFALADEDFAAVDGVLVRMGVHTGYAEERDADYFGPSVNRVARLMSIGHGGQVLLSASTHELVRGDLPTGASLLDLGSHRLRGLSEPERVWQLAVDGLPAAFPPLASLDAVPNNLPNEPTSFCGRENDLKDVKALLGKHRLLTLCGPGGVGKTRLAVKAASDLLECYPDGVWLADLAPIAEEELVPSVVAKVLGISHDEGRPLDEWIPQRLKHKKLLLVLDNCEHVLETAAGIAEAIVRNCGGVRTIATSRQALGISGEEVLRLGSLDVPDSSPALSAAAMLEFGAVALFVDRARSIDKSFAFDDANAPIVAEICRRLDGIPLAIELAAARVNVLSLPNLAQRLNERFKILTGGSRSALPRQKTLGALIDWSYDLLTSREQALFRHSSVFAGDFGLDSATAVCARDGEDELDILDLLSSLHDKSLVVAETGGEQARYHLLESTRAYALAKLWTDGEHERVALRHAAYFRDRAQAADARFGNGPTVAWLASVELDLDNYRAALEWALTAGRDASLGGTLAGSLMWLWTRGGLAVEGRYWIGRAQATLDESALPEVAARMWRTLGLISDGKEKRDCAERALTLYRSVGDAHGEARALLILGFAYYQMGKIEESGQSYALALPALRECGDRSGVAWCLSHQAEILRLLGAIDAAREMFAQALAAYKSLGDEYGTAMVLGDLAELEFADDRAERALEVANEGLGDYVGENNATNMARPRFSTITFQALTFTSATSCIALGDLDRARDLVRDGLRHARLVQSALGIAVAVQLFALFRALRNEERDAARLIGFVNLQLEGLGYERGSTEKWCFERLMAALRGNLTEAEIEKLEHEGASWSEERAIEEALKECPPG
jgi:predicted ATPase/class 3 adenylate cyclase